MNQKRLATQGGLGALLLVGAIIFSATRTDPRQAAWSAQKEENVSPAPVAAPKPRAVQGEENLNAPRTVARVQISPQAAPNPPTTSTAMAPTTDAGQPAPEELPTPLVAGTVWFLIIAVLSVVSMRKLATGREMPRRALADGAQV